MFVAHSIGCVQVAFTREHGRVSGLEQVAAGEESRGRGLGSPYVQWAGGIAGLKFGGGGEGP